MGTVKLPVLQPGDTVSLIAPARAVSVEEMQPFIQWLRDKHLIVKTGKHLFGRQHQFSAADIDRAEDFAMAWTDPDVKAVFCGRGGYGCMRILEFLDDDVLEAGKGKMLAGFSDITTLHLALNKRGIETLHSPLAINFFEPKKGTGDNFIHMEKVMFTGKCGFDLGQADGIRKGRFSGEITGGNLSLIYAALGTPEQPDTNGKILFLEDLDEYLYHVDRMMVSLKRAGLLSNLSALLVGGMDKMNDNMVPFGQDAYEIIAHHTAEYSYPVIFGFPAGHGLENRAFKLGAFTTFDGSMLRQE